MARKNGTQSRILINLMISSVLGAIGYGGSAVVNASQQVVFGLSVSLFIAGIAFVVQFLYEVERRLDQMEDAYRKQAAETIQGITEGFKKINEATELYGLVEASAVRTDMMTQLVRNSTRLEPSPTLLFDFAQSEIIRLSDMLKTLSDGADLTYEGEDRDWMLGLTRATKHSIDATSLNSVDAGGVGFGDGGLWASDLGQRYLDTQSDAIRRGVTIRRVFIMDRADMIDDPDFLSACNQHKAIGIQVRILDPSKVIGVRREGMFDFVVFDGVLSYQSIPASRIVDRGRPVIVRTQLVTKQETVDGRIKRFAVLWDAATPA